MQPAKIFLDTVCSRAMGTLCGSPASCRSATSHRLQRVPVGVTDDGRRPAVEVVALVSGQEP